jgi:energy-converting hydrogenase A subunit R
MHRLQLDTDCEGPLALNDNAFELCRDFLRPRGDFFFRQVSHYDDYLAGVLKKPDYKAGTTLKLIPPFLKAAGLTNAMMRDYSRKTVKLMPGAAEAYRFLHGRGYPIFEVSTSYRQFAEAVGLELGLDGERIFGTELDLDRYRLSPAEAEELGCLQSAILAAAPIVFPPEASSPDELAGPVREAIAILDRIFGEEIPALEIGAIFRDVEPMGGADKARALSESLTKTGFSLAEVIYVGDSFTDVQAFEAVRAGGGLSISFNGDHHAVAAAEVVVVSDTAWPVALLASIFQLWGKEGVLEVAAPETSRKSRTLVLPEEVIEPIARGLHGGVFNLYLSNSPDRDRLVRESAAMRARLRGEAIADLG